MTEWLRFSPLRHGIVRAIAGGGGFTYQTIDGQPAEFLSGRKKVKPVVAHNLMRMLADGLLKAEGGRLALTSWGYEHMDSWAGRSLTYALTREAR